MKNLEFQVIGNKTKDLTKELMR